MAREINAELLDTKIEKAQKKLEGNNFGIRKNLLEYDQVMNEQREIIYEERRRVLDGESMRDTIYNMMTEYVENMTDRFAAPDAENSEEWDLAGLELTLHGEIPMLKMPDAEEVKDMRQKELKHTLKEQCCKSIRGERSRIPGGGADS